MEISFWVQISTIIAGISTLIYTIVTLRTLNELKIQRESTYYPEIIIVDQLFHFYFDSEINEIKTEFDTFDFVSDKFYENIEDNSIVYKYPKIRLYNIGLGPAKNIKLNLYYKPDELISIVNKMQDNLSDDDIYFRDISYSGNEITFSDYYEVGDSGIYPDIPFYGLINENDSYNFLLPNKDDTNCITIFYPHIFKVLISHSIRNYFLKRYIYHKNEEEHDDENNIQNSNNELPLFENEDDESGNDLCERLKPTIPDLYLDIEYQDINNKKHKREYILRTNYQLTFLNNCSIFNSTSELKKKTIMERLNLFH
jgi:hypothetical protein